MGRDWACAPIVSTVLPRPDGGLEAMGTHDSIKVPLSRPATDLPICGIPLGPDGAPRLIAHVAASVLAGVSAL